MLSDAIIDRNVHLSALVLSTEMPEAGGQGGALPPDFGAIVWVSLSINRDYGPKNIFFRNKTFLFFKIES